MKQEERGLEAYWLYYIKNDRTPARPASDTEQSKDNLEEDGMKGKGEYRENSNIVREKYNRKE